MCEKDSIALHGIPSCGAICISSALPTHTAKLESEMCVSEMFKRVKQFIFKKCLSLFHSCFAWVKAKFGVHIHFDKIKLLF